MKLNAATRLISSKVLSSRRTGKGAGAVFYAQDTGRFLLVKRSDTCDYPGTWCGLGGGVEAHETLEEAVRREAYEEAGLAVDEPYVLHCIGTQGDENFQFTNFIGVIDREFEPVLNSEHTDYKWHTLDTFPADTHPKMMESLNSPMARILLDQHTTATLNQEI